MFHAIRQRLTVPSIPQQAIDESVVFMRGEVLVKDAAIAIKGRDVVLSLIVNRATNEETARRLGDNFVRFLAGAVNRWSDDERLNKRPTKDYYGGLWDHYNAHIVVAFDANTVFQRGTKSRRAASIEW